LLFFVAGVISFGAYRVGQQSSESQQAQDVVNPELAGDIKVVEEEKTTEVVTIPADEKVVEKVAEPVVEKKVVTETIEKKKEDKVWLEMTKVVGAQEGSVVKVQSKLPQALSGTCNFKLWQDGYDKVYSSNQITNSVDCIGQLDVSNLPTYSGWSLHVWFDGSDGKTHAYQKEAPITLQQP
jgi:hypothetical protein